AMLINAQWRVKLEPLAALVEAKQYQQAIAGYSKVLEHTPVLRAYAMRGYSYAQLGQDEKAIEDYNRVLEVDPHGGCCPGTRSNRGRAYLKAGKKELALQDLLDAAARDDAWAAREVQWWRLAAAQGNQRAAAKLREHGYWWSYFRYVVLRDFLT